MTKLWKEFSVACIGKAASTYRFPGADLVLFACSHQTMLSKIRKFSSKIDSGLYTKITSSPPKYRLLQQNIEFSTKIKDSPPKYVGVCSSNSLATRWGTRNLTYILAFIPLNLLTTSAYTTSPYFSCSSLLTSSSIVAVLITKAGHVWVSWPEEFLLYFLSLTLQQVCYCQGID